MPDLEPDPRSSLGGEQTLRRSLGTGLVLLGGLALVGGQVRHRRVDAALRAGAPLPRPKTCSR